MKTKRHIKLSFFQSHKRERIVTKIKGRISVVRAGVIGTNAGAKLCVKNGPSS